MFDILIAAAGGSKRMTGIKQLLPFGDSTFIERTIQKAMALEPRNIAVILGAYSDKIAPVIQHYPVGLVENPQWEKGLGGSIATGVHYIEAQYGYTEGLMVLLCDQPLLVQDSNFLEDFVAEWENTPDQIMATRYESKLGVPALFPAKFMVHLKNLKGDKGARELLNSGHFPVKSIDSRGIGIDIDTDEAYKRFLKA